MRLLFALLSCLAAALPGRLAAQDPTRSPSPSPATQQPPDAGSGSGHRSLFHLPEALARWRFVWTGKRHIRLSERVYAEVRAPRSLRTLSSPPHRYVPLTVVITF